MSVFTAARYSAWCVNFGARPSMEASTSSTNLDAVSAECCSQLIEPSFSCIGRRASMVSCSFNQLGSVCAQLAFLPAAALATVLELANQPVMFKRNWRLSKSSIESSPKMSESASTATRPDWCFTARPSAAPAGLAVSLERMITSELLAELDSRTPAR